MRKMIAVLSVAALPVLSACTQAPRPVTIIEDGCLTASGSRFVLTDLEHAEPQPSLRHQRPVGTRARATTEAYMLIGADEKPMNDKKLTNMVGKRVRVVGEADPAQIAEIIQMSPRIPARTVGASPLKPAVSDYDVLRFEVHRLRTRSVTPTGDDCSAEFRAGV